MRKLVFLFIFLTALFFASLFILGNSQLSVKNNDGLVKSGLTVYFFYGQGCPHCARVEPFISQMEQAYGLNVKRFEIYYNRSNMLILQDYFDKYNVPAGSRGIPIVFTSEGYVEGDINILNGFESLILNSSRVNSEQMDTLSQVNSKTDSSANANVDPLSFFTITVAALVDSINPCSMAILFFLLAGLLLLHKRNKALKVGLAFTTSVFIANLMFGFGILTTIAVSGLASIFKVAAGLIAILTGVLLLKDAFHYGGGGFKMEVPEFLRSYLKHKLSKAFYGKSSSIVSAFLVGFLVTSFEVPCTGGPYFYVLAGMADNATRLQTIPILLYYNVIFVTPLVLITAMLYFGSVHVEKAREWKEQNKRLINFVRGLPMIAVGLITIPAAQISQTLNIYKTLYLPLIIPLIAYVTFQFLSKNRNRNKTTKWIITTILTMTIIATAITTAQTITPKQTKPKTTSTSALSPCPDPSNVTECCIMDQPRFYYITTDIKAGGDCFIITGATGATCQSHSITGNGNGIAFNISNRDNVIIQYCRITNFTVGVDVEPSSDLAIIEKSVIRDNFIGIHFRQTTSSLSVHHFVRNNIFVSNGIGLAVIGAEDSKIYNNYFVNQHYNVIDESGSINYWNTTKASGTNIIGGSYIGGNYWSDYYGEDTDGDGIGDTNLPYTANGWIPNGGDYLPLTDEKPPEYMNIQAPTGSITYSPAATYDFNITWKDNVQLDKVIFEFDGVNQTLSKANEYFGFNANYRVEDRANYSIGYTGLSSGFHSYRWYANDTHSYWNSTGLFNFTLVDVDPPALTIFQPQNITYNSSWVPVKLNVNEPVLWVAYSLDNQANVTLWTNVPLGTYMKYIYIENFGSHKVIFYAKDQAGNIGKTETIYFTNRYVQLGGGRTRAPLLM